MADFLKEAAEKDSDADEKSEKYKEILSVVKPVKETVEDDDMEMEITWEPGNHRVLNYTQTKGLERVS